jgi:hypothetical protein
VQAEYSESDGDNTLVFIFKKRWPVNIIVYFFEISMKVPISATITICKLQISSRLLRIGEPEESHGYLEVLSR